MVLARRHNQRLRIGDNVVVTVIELRPGVVRLGVEAPPDVAVWREELWDKVQAEKRERGEL